MMKVSAMNPSGQDEHNPTKIWRDFRTCFSCSVEKKGDFEGLFQDKQFTAHAIRRRDSLNLILLPYKLCNNVVASVLCEAIPGLTGNFYQEAPSI